MASFSSSAAAPSPSAPRALSKEEAAVYDRQIRLWGVEAQQRLQSSRVLVCGRFSATAAEVSKNLVLAGFSACVMDPDPCAPEDLGANFLLPPEGVGQNRALAARARLQELNPMVDVQCRAQPTAAVTADFLRAEKFNVVLLSGPCPRAEIARVNAACRAVGSGVAFFFVDTFGFLGFAFADLGDDFAYRAGSAEAGTEKLERVHYVPFATAQAAPWSALTERRFGTPPIYFAWHALHAFQEERAAARATAAQAGEIYNETEPRQVDVTASATRTCVAQGVDAATVDPDVLATMVRCVGRDVGPACAILGGLVGQEVVKSIARKSKPLQNVFLLDAMAQTSQKGGVVVSKIGL